MVPCSCKAHLICEILNGGLHSEEALLRAAVTSICHSIVRKMARRNIAALDVRKRTQVNPNSSKYIKPFAEASVPWFNDWVTRGGWRHSLY
eukprot:5344350-Amphidinium_carterae.1